jgi:hypothetical protein
MALSDATATSPRSPSNPEDDTLAGGRELNRPVFYLRLENLLPLFVLAAGFIARLIPAWRYFLNPDEALHNLLASQSSVSLAYRAALTNAHPPLLILILYYWRSLGQSELWLRMPSVMAGTAACWLTHEWLKQATDRAIAFTGLLLFAFAPALIGLSAEIRQYALLLFFMTGCLYLSERAIRENSLPLMVLCSLSLYGALLVHYSSLLFALTMGVYLLVRLYPYGKNPRLFAAWVCGQIGGIALAGYFLLTHVVHLMESRMLRGAAETYMRKSFFHSGENSVAGFVSLQSLRVFTFLFSHGVVGTLALLAFLMGMVLLLRGKASRGGPAPRQLALLLGFPFVASCGTALAGVYPYGGTRHNIFLAPFAVAGASIALAAWKTARPWAKYFAIAAALALCNFFPAPPPLIRARNQARSLMIDAVGSLRQSAPPGSVIFSDYQSGLLLGYYACGHGVVQTFPPFQPYVRNDCGPYAVITAYPGEWKFYAYDFPSQVANLTKSYGLVPGTRIWLFDAGWISDSSPALSRELQRLGCTVPRKFGENIFLCQLTVGGDAGSTGNGAITN